MIIDNLKFRFHFTELVNYTIKCSYCRKILIFTYIYVLAGIDRPRAVSLRSDRGSRAFPSLELDTVVEERSDPEQSTALELSSPD